MLLAEVTDRHNDGGGDELAENGIPLKEFHEKLEEEVINAQIGKKGDEISYELNATPEIG